MNNICMQGQQMTDNNNQQQSRKKMSVSVEKKPAELRASLYGHISG